MAARFGIWNVEQDGDGWIYHLTDWQLYQWLSFEEDNPLGDTRADLNHGIVASALSNEMRVLQSIVSAAHGGDYRPVLTSPVDFMPYVKREIGRGQGRGQEKTQTAPTTRSQFESFKSAVRAMGRGMGQRKGTVI